MGVYIRRNSLGKTDLHPQRCRRQALAAFYETPPLAYVRSYGCQQNVNDGEKIKGVLQDVGYGLCDNVEHADLILFNTCAVREHAEQRVFGNVGALKKLKEQNPRLMIGVCGCMAQQEHIVEKLRQSYPYVDLVFGVDGIDRLPAMLAERIRKGKRYLEKPAERNAVVEELPIRRDSGFRAWLPIMYGCDNFCTYCIVPSSAGGNAAANPPQFWQNSGSLLSRAIRRSPSWARTSTATARGWNIPSTLRPFEPAVRSPRRLPDPLHDEHPRTPAASSSTRLPRRSICASISTCPCSPARTGFSRR